MKFTVKRYYKDVQAAFKWEQKYQLQNKSDDTFFFLIKKQVYRLEYKEMTWQHTLPISSGYNWEYW